MTGPTGEEWLRGDYPAKPPRRRRPKAPDYGAYSEMTAVLDIVYADTNLEAAVALLVARYPHLEDEPTKPVSEFVYNARRFADKKQHTDAARLAHDFIVKQGRVAEPPVEPPARRRWWHIGRGQR